MATRVNPSGGQGSASKPKKPNKPRPSAKVANRANKTRQRSNNDMFGAVGGYNGVDTDMVRQLVNSTVRPELMAMRNDRKYVNRQATNALSDNESLYNRSVGDLNYVFGEAGDYINSLGAKIGAGYDQTAQSVAGMDAAGQSAMQANTTAAQQAINSQLQGLGLLQTAGVDPTLQQDAAFAQGQAVQQGTNNQTNLAASKQGAATLTGLLGGMIQGSHASNAGLAVQNRQTGANDINRAKQEDMSTINESMQQLRAGKPGMIREMLLQLQAQGFDQWQAIQALNMDRRQLNHSIGMDNAQMNQQAAYYGTGAQAWSAQAGSTPGVSTGTSSTPNWNSANPSWTPNPGKPTKPPKSGPKKPPRRGGSGYNPGRGNDAIYGPVAGD